MGQMHLEQLFGLRGQVALITGASSGLGIEFARGLAMAGANVALLARRIDRLQTVAKSCEALGVHALPVQADLSDEDQIDAAIEQVTTHLGPIDILVNNAGVAPVSRAEHHDKTKWQQALDINLTAVFYVLKKLANR